MVTVTEFKGEFLGKIETIYSINNTNPEGKTWGGHMTTSEICPKCKSRNLFRLYEPKREFKTERYCIAIYDCRCPNCNTNFEIKDEFDKLED